ncbi:MAG: YeeE/YedE family protein [Gemmatimonadetes bacterium]|nr:YeeE/YedE family protein [Gemmatimonadota bacterium]
MPAATSAPAEKHEQARSAESLVVYLLLGLFLGIVFLKSEVASWFRIQEMFRFQAFRMYGVIGGAVAVGALGVALLKRTGALTIRGEPIQFPDAEERRPGIRHFAGGTCFGLGWGLLGACPGPIYALLGSGLGVMLVALVSALAGAWVYGLLRPELPH